MNFYHNTKYGYIVYTIKLHCSKTYFEVFWNALHDVILAK